MAQINSAFTLFMSLMVEAMPFLLLGVLFSGLLQFFIDERKLVAILPKNAFLGAFVGSCIGFLFPVCECGNVPVARRLLLQGAPTSVAIGFLLAAPTINPIVFWATWTAFRDQPEVVFFRILFSLIIATVIGWVFSVQKDVRPLLQSGVAAYMNRKLEASSSASPLLQSGTYFLGQSNKPLITDPLEYQAMLSNKTEKPANYRFHLLLDNTIQEMRELGGVLVLGSAIAAILQVFVPRDFILGLGQDNVTSILAMLLLAAVVSICSTVGSFFALSFASTFTTGSLVAFLVFGPMIDLKGVGLMLSVFKPRAILYIFGLAGLLTFLFCLFVNLYIS
ncbi:permease [Leptolyngbya sp. FACHB-402]|uniref:permease n=1 Tax=Leptolyngbya sp. FACHB-402 TaxID=2692809 RepID=UPI00168475F5|nr:permease [Leptolyngbya sp. FACHB-402]MBD2408025.1 permease [Leptolyngbya sp. FACHB-402]